MIRRFIYGAFALALLCGQADAQNLSKLCVVGSNSNSCIPVTASAPLPVTPSSPSGTQNVTIIPTAAAGVATSYSATAALASNKVVKGSAGNLYSLQVAADSTLSAANWWIMIFDATSLPGDGAITPAKCYGIPAGITGASFAFPNPIRLATGITVGVSTTGCFTQTASIHAFISGDAQ